MIETFKNWLKERFSAEESSPEPRMSATGVHRRLRPAPQTQTDRIPERQPLDYFDPDEHPGSTIESLGPGKNVLIQNKYVREDSGTHDSLKILDDSMVDSGEETGIDPYNTGGFDRSKNWDTRFRK